MQKKSPTHELVLKNERAWTFYNSHTSINFETANLLLIDFLETMFTHKSYHLCKNTAQK